MMHVRFTFMLVLATAFLFISCKKEDTLGPVITITSPAEGATLERGKNYPLQGMVTDDLGLGKITLGNLNITTFDSATKHTFANINVTIGANDPVGTSVITITAEDNAGNVTTKNVTVKIQ